MLLIILVSSESYFQAVKSHIREREGFIKSGGEVVSGITLKELQFAGKHLAKLSLISK